MSTGRGRPIDLVTCTNDGQFLIGRLEPGAYTIVAVVERDLDWGVPRTGRPDFVGTAEVNITADGPPPEPLKIELLPWAVATNRPAAQPRVPPRPVSSNAPPELGSNSLGFTRTETNQSLPRQDLTMEWSFEGHVVDDATGEPVTNIVLQTGKANPQKPEDIQWDQQFLGPWLGKPDFFSVRTSNPWETWRVLADGYLPELVSAPPHFSSAHNNGLVVRLKRGGELRGTVFNHLGEPVTGAQVFLKRLQQTRIVDDHTQPVIRGSTAITDSAGRFVLSGVGQTDRTIVVMCDSLQFFQVTNTTPDAEMRITLPEPASLTVRYDIPYDLPEARVELDYLVNGVLEPVSWDAFEIQHHPFISNHGSFTLTNLPPGTYHFIRMKKLSAGDMELGKPIEQIRIALESGQDKSIELVRTNGFPVRGSVIGVTNTEAAGVLLYVQSSEATSLPWEPAMMMQRTFDALTCGKDGEFQTALLEPGTYSITAEAYKPETPEFAGSEGQHVRVFRSGIRLPDYVGSVNVTVTANRAPEPVKIELRPWSATTNQSPARVPISPKPISLPELSQQSVHNESDWGKATNGLRTRVWAETNVFRSGQPIQLKLEVTNITDAAKSFQTPAAPWNSGLTVLDSRGKPVPYIAGSAQVAVPAIDLGPHRVDAPKLFDLADYFYVRSPGRYTVIWTNEIFLPRPDERVVPLPPAAPFTFEVVPDPEANADGDPIGKLLPLLKENWSIGTGGTHTNRVQPGSNHQEVAGQLLTLQYNPTGYKADSGLVWLWLTDEVAAEQTATGDWPPPSEYLGNLSRWHVYFNASTNVLRAWPTVKEDVIGALSGVQVRLHAERTRWGLNEQPELLVDIANRGASRFGCSTNYAHWDLEVNGHWYSYGLQSAHYSPDLVGPHPGQTLTDLPLELDAAWFFFRPDQTPEWLRLTPGKHVLRVRVGGFPRMISNPLEIEISTGSEVESGKTTTVELDAARTNSVSGEQESSTRTRTNTPPANPESVSTSAARPIHNRVWRTNSQSARHYPVRSVTPHEPVFRIRLTA